MHAHNKNLSCPRAIAETLNECGNIAKKKDANESRYTPRHIIKFTALVTFENELQIVEG